MTMLSFDALSVPALPKRRWGMVIDGVQRFTDETHAVIDPGTAQRIAEVPVASPTDVDDAVSAARRSFDEGVWRDIPADQRVRVLLRIADLIEERIEEFARVEAFNQGAPYSGMIGSRVPEVARVFRYYAGWADKLAGTASDLRRPNIHAFTYTQLKPVGVAALITPWNNPLGMAAWKAAPALAVGCSCVIKPAEDTPLTSIMLAEIALEAGLPKGVLNVITGRGSVAGNRLVEHPDVDKVSFTGSTETGRRIITSSLSNLKKVSLELGGKSPVIVFDDADIEEAALGAARAIFSNSGQVCTAGSRLLIQDGIYDRVIERLVEHAKSLNVGYTFDERAEMGPLISQKQYDTVTSYVQSAVEEGATIAAGGTGEGPGFYMLPTVITDVNPSMTVVREEIFGPVVAAMRFSTEEEALRLAHDTEYGLAASIWTQNVKRAHRIAERLRAGRIGINVHAWPDVTMPTGGFKQSGWGRELGPNGLDAYLETSSVFTKLS
jgi:phenylacetaldehyde dehydrogenase